MALRRFTELPEFAQLRGEMDRVLGDFVGNLPRWGIAPWAGARQFPPLNIWEDQDALYAEAELAGVASENVDVSVVGNELSISGERQARQEEGVAYHRQERGQGAFRRTLRLPVEVDADAVSAQLKDGILTVRLPKAAAAKPRKINVATA